MANETIIYDKLNGVATITLNRPQALNAFVPQMNKEVLEALRDGERDKEVRCFMITGAGRAFCAGQDLKGRTPEQKGSLGASLREKYNPMIRQIRAMEKIVIAAVNGVAAGAGCNFALACDLRVASEEAKFIQSFVRVGLAPDSGGSFILTRLVGLSKAMELLLLGDTVDAKEAQRIGLLNHLVPCAQLRQKTMELGTMIATNRHDAVMGVKALLIEDMGRNLEEQWANERRYTTDVIRGAKAETAFPEFIARRGRRLPS